MDTQTFSSQFEAREAIDQEAGEPGDAYAVWIRCAITAPPPPIVSGKAHGSSPRRLRHRSRHERGLGGVAYRAPTAQAPVTAWSPQLRRRRPPNRRCSR